MSDPYAPPSAAARTEPVDVQDAAAQRSAHLEYEAALLALGWWNYAIAGLQLGFGLMCAMMALMLMAVDPPPDEAFSPATMAVIMAVFAVVSLSFGALSAYSAWGARSFSPEARVPGLINAGIQVTFFPFGLIPGVAGLYLLLLPTSGAVLSYHYQDVRAATPELRARWHPLFWALPATFLISGGVFGLMMALSVWSVIAQGAS